MYPRSTNKTPILKFRPPKVQQQSDMDVGRTQVIHDLGAVTGVQRRARFQLNDHATIHNNIRDVVPNNCISIPYLQRTLLSTSKPASPQLNSKSIRVNSLHKSSAKPIVHGKRSLKNLPSKLTLRICRIHNIRVVFNP